MLLRSLLFIPADSPRMLLRSDVMRADMIIFDLEDGVAPERKVQARELLRAYLMSGLTSCQCMVRVNQVRGPEFAKDMAALRGVPFDGLYLPKVEQPEEVRQAAEALESLEAGTEKTGRFLFNTVETPLGLENAMACMQASERVMGVCLGSEDYAASLGVQRSEDYTELDYARRRLVNLARAAGRKAVDTVFADAADLEGLRAQTLYGKRLGYDGKAAISPAQIPVIHSVFAPSGEEVRHAREVVRALEQAAGAIAVLNGKMIDKPVAEQARHILELAQSI